jgi:transposase
MKSLAELEHFDLNTASQSDMADMIQTLIAQVQRDAETLSAKDAAIQAKDAAIRAKDFKIEALTHEIAYYRRIRFSAKNESLSPLQRDLFQETWNTDMSAIEAELEQLKDDQPGETVVKPQRPRAGRQPLPTHLPRIEHRHEPESCTCGKCGQDLVKIGEDVTEQLDVEPAKFFVHRHIRPQYACKHC